MADYDPIDVRGQELDKTELDARKAAARKQEIADLRWMMSCPAGRRIMWRLLSLSGPFRSSFDTNAMKMAFNEGKRQLGVQLLDEVKTLCPKMYAVMEEEQQK